LQITPVPVCDLVPASIGYSGYSVTIQNYYLNLSGKALFREKRITESCFI